jgi:hypothetical protein
VAEELRLEQLLGDRGAVDRREGVGGTGAHAVDGTGEHLLAGAALAGDEHRGGVRRHPLGELEQPAQRTALGDHEVAHRLRPQRGAQRLDLALEALALLGLAERQQHFIGLERLVEVVVRALPHRGDGRVLAAIGAHHEEQRRAVLGTVAAEERQAVHARHPHVAEDRVEAFDERARQRLLGIGFGRGLVAGLVQEQAPATAAGPRRHQR